MCMRDTKLLSYDVENCGLFAFKTDLNAMLWLNTLRKPFFRKKIDEFEKKNFLLLNLYFLLDFGEAVHHKISPPT